MKFKPYISKSLHVISYFLFAAVLFAFVTGGTVLHLGRAKIEVSALDPWVLALAAVIAILHFYFKEKSWVLEKSQLAFDEFEKKPKAAFWFMGSVALIAFFAHLARHFSFHENAFDVSFVHPPLFNAFSNPLLKCDVCLGGALPGEHMALSFLVFAPLVNLFRETVFHDGWIYLLQVVLLVGSAALLILRGPLREKRELWFSAALILLSHRAFRAAMVWDFREDILAFVGFSLALVFLYEKKWLKFFASLCLAIFSKENMAFVLPFFAVSIVLSSEIDFARTRRILLAITVLVLGVSYAAITFKWLMPFFNQAGGQFHPISSRFASYGSTPGEILVNVLTNPKVWMSLISEKITSVKIYKYLVLLLAPVGFVAFRKPIWLIPALAGIAMNVLSSSETQWSLQFHYDLLILPFLFFATLMGLGQLTSKQRQIAVLVALAFSGRWPMRALTEHWPTLDQVRDSVYLSQISSTGVLSADLTLLPQVSQMSSLRVMTDPKVAVASENLWLEFSKYQTEDLTRAGARASQANRFLLDLTKPWHRKLADSAAKDSQYWLEPVSPSGRYQVINRIVLR